MCGLKFKDFIAVRLCPTMELNTKTFEALVQMRFRVTACNHSFFHHLLVYFVSSVCDNSAL